MALHEQIEALARKHGATSYRNRADTQHPAYGFTPSGLLNLVADVRKQDTALIRQMLDALECAGAYTALIDDVSLTAIREAHKAASARLEGNP